MNLELSSPLDPAQTARRAAIAGYQTEGQNAAEISFLAMPGSAG
jgi:hypothetical protein